MISDLVFSRDPVRKKEEGEYKTRDEEAKQCRL